MPLSSALSQLHILCVAPQIIRLSEMCPLKLTDFCPFLYHQSCTILQGPLIPPMAFISCCDRGSNLQPPDGESQHSNHAAIPNCFSVRTSYRTPHCSSFFQIINISPHSVLFPKFRIVSVRSKYIYKNTLKM